MTGAQVDEMGSGTAATPIAVGGNSSSAKKWLILSKFLNLQIEATDDVEQDEAYNVRHYGPLLYKAYYSQFHGLLPYVFTPAIEQHICVMIGMMASSGTFHNSLQMVMDNCSCKTHRHAPPPSTWSDAWFTGGRFVVALRPVPKHRYVIVVIDPHVRCPLHALTPVTSVTDYLHYHVVCYNVPHSLNSLPSESHIATILLEHAGKSQPPKPGDIPIFSVQKVGNLDSPLGYYPKVPNLNSTYPNNPQPAFNCELAIAAIADFIEGRLTAIVANGAWKDAVDGCGV